MMLPKPFYKHLLLALLVGMGLRLSLVGRFPFASGDRPYYEELAEIGSVTVFTAFSQMVRRDSERKLSLWRNICL
jgi:hypothetical protein